MSDFDAEAERKRLREKYEAEAENRKQTQQMSELLLKGATMTNRHCGECGSPIFRYDDQEFCPNCQRATEADREDDTGADAAEADAAEAADTTAMNADEGGASAASESAAEPETDTATTTGSTSDTAASNGVGATGDPERGRNTVRPAAETTIDRDSPDAGGRRDAGDRPDATAESAAGGGATAPTRGDARESLLGALTRHARLAADTDEPRRATEHLEAARTAAAALDELDGS